MLGPYLIKKQMKKHIFILIFSTMSCHGMQWYETIKQRTQCKHELLCQRAYLEGFYSDEDAEESIQEPPPALPPRPKQLSDETTTDSNVEIIYVTSDNAPLIVTRVHVNAWSSSPSTEEFELKQSHSKKETLESILHQDIQKYQAKTTRLEIINSQLKKITLKNMLVFKNLETIILLGNQLEHIDLNAFDQCPNLSKITISVDKLNLNTIQALFKKYRTKIQFFCN